MNKNKSHILQANYKKRINYNYFIRLALYNSIILSIMIYLINFITN